MFYWSLDASLVIRELFATVTVDFIFVVLQFVSLLFEKCYLNGSSMNKNIIGV